MLHRAVFLFYFQTTTDLVYECNPQTEVDFYFVRMQIPVWPMGTKSPPVFPFVCLNINFKIQIYKQAVADSRLGTYAIMMLQHAKVQHAITIPTHLLEDPLKRNRAPTE